MMDLTAPASPAQVANIKSDLLSECLSAIHAEAGTVSLHRACAPWQLFVPRGSTYFCVVTRGIVCLTDSACDKVRLGEGDIAIFPRGKAHTLFAAAEQDDSGHNETANSGVNGAGGIEFLLAECSLVGAAGHPLVDVLPDVMRLPSSAEPLGLTVHALLSMLRGGDLSPDGSNAVVLRHLEVIFIYAVRNWLADSTNAGNFWFGASRDPILSEILSQIHANPGQEWTLARMAQIAGVSRSTVSKLFGDFVGTSPMNYVANWRLALAARLLRQERLTVRETADRVGYGAQAAFSRIFKRQFGVSPAIYRDCDQDDLLLHRSTAGAVQMMTLSDSE